MFIETLASELYRTISNYIELGRASVSFLFYQSFAIIKSINQSINGLLINTTQLK